jgi:hypothetical protein
VPVDELTSGIGVGVKFDGASSAGASLKVLGVEGVEGAAAGAELGAEL